MEPKLHLASASPRRHELLRTLGLEFSFGGENLDEQRQDGESAADMVVRLAGEKAAAAATARPDSAVLGADTEVVLGDRIFGKPASRQDALRMLESLSGRTHHVMTGVVLLRHGVARSALCVSHVRFRQISPAEADAYWRTGEPKDKAGGYAIQGCGGIFAEEIRGSYSGVVGLPVYDVALLLRDAGIAVPGPVNRP